MLVGEFVQNKLLGQTEDDMKPYASTEISEYQTSAAIRLWIVSIGKRSGNQRAAQLRVVRLQFPIVRLTDKWSYDGVASPRPLCVSALIEIARVLMQERGQNSIREQAFTDAAGEVSTEPLAISPCTSAIIGHIRGLLDSGP